MISKIKNHLLLKFLIYKYFKKEDRIKSFNHKIYHHSHYLFHRIQVSAKNGKAWGVGVDKNLRMAQLIALMEFIERDFFYKEKRSGTTSGFSCHTDPNLAKKKSLFELIERDQVLLTIYFKNELTEIIDGAQITNIRFFHMNFDLPIHVVMAALKTNENTTVYGFGTSLILKEAIEKSLKEALVASDYPHELVNNFNDQVLGGSLAHLIPFLNPKIKTTLPLFSIKDYKICKVQRSKLIDNYNLNNLYETMNKKNIAIDYRIKKFNLNFLTKIYFCEAITNSLQNLFFSKDKIYLNEERVDIAKVNRNDLRFVLHPIS